MAGKCSCKGSDYYGAVTLNDVVRFVKAHPDAYPNGMHTEIVAGDFEGNYTHSKFGFERDGYKLCLAYEMHEGWWNI